MNRWLFLLLGCLLWTAPAYAHKPSDSYLNLKVIDNQIQGQWDIALRDLDYALGLDRNDDGALTWGEVNSQRSQVEAYALTRLNLKTCTLKPTDYLVDNHSDGAYAVLKFAATCAQAPQTLDLTYRLFFDLDPQHRGLLQLTTAGQTRSAIFSPEQAQQQFMLVATPDLVGQGLTFIREGIWHIWSGFDHILFLLTLLLPAVLIRQGKQWVSVANLRAAFTNVLKIVTAFTVAHSLTLALATLGIVQLPSRFVESAIALSVLIAALNNIYPVVQSRLWAVAFGFGLIHGFGFASVLKDLGLEKGSLLVSLLSFNVGVELGQLVIVIAFLPVAFLARTAKAYPKLGLVGGSAIIAGVATLWLVERVFDLQVWAF